MKAGGPQPVMSLDGNLILVNRRNFLQAGCEYPNLGGFHGYDLVLALECLRKDFRARAGRQEPRLNPAAVARALQLVEWIVLKFDRLAGDETAVIATKTARIHRREKLLPEGRTRAAPGSEAISTPVASRRPVDAL
jgi:hypothetical protein